MGANRSHPRGARPGWFLLAVLAWTWGFLWPATLTGQAWLAFPTVLLTVAGMVGPLLVTLLFVAAGLWDAPPGAFWRQALDPRRVAGRWHLVAVALAVVLAGGPVLLAAAGRGEPPWALVTGSTLPAYLLVGALAGVVEEPAWRGYAQVGLQRRLPVVAATLVVGLAWAAWHLPLFFLEGTYQATLGVGTPGFWSFHAAILLGSFVYAWLVGTSGTAVVAVVYHASSNVLREAWSVDGAEVAALVTEGLLAVVLVGLGWRWMGRPLGECVDGR